ncbi:MAG TPA: 50S ribosomal protein L15 [Candidatus Cloacimonadota bacterium]|nr:50S ribosomal protein L15 [Candidatus Cloacimonadota bacterium]HOV17278.1 50S ribosomal protein L15 [Candidatus Cloacimonadota bacterium]HQL14658.1 50S ribosomal protein L15 [Candidatus Cloacimonadota bacterium]
MLTLSNLKRPEGYKKKKRLGKGQGSGHGHQAGRGHKGNKARAGGNIPAWFEGGQMPIQRRLPKRGFKNIFKVEYRILNLNRLQDYDEQEWDIKKFEEKGLIISKGKKADAPVKILAGSAEDFTKAVHIKANAFSKNAIAVIEKNGGKAEVI